MLLLSCPYCGAREETEFRYGGEGVDLPSEADDHVWTRFLYYRDAPSGWFTERWAHTYGCRQWFTVLRDTRTHEIAATSKLDQAPEKPR